VRKRSSVRIKLDPMTIDEKNEDDVDGDMGGKLRCYRAHLS
jgi:hypothetical protein